MSKSKVIEMKCEEGIVEAIEAEVVETTTLKKKWSLKKKLAIGAAALVGLGIGAYALGRKTKSDEELVDEEIIEDDEIYDDVEETTEEEVVEEPIEQVAEIQC